MKKYLIVIISSILAGIGIFLFLQNRSFERISPKVAPEINTSNLTFSPTLSPGLPQKLVIPNLNIEVPIEHVKKDKEGLMDIPKNVNNTAWYSLGPKPGEVGNSAIAGHFDTPTGAPSVFYKLNTLSLGDEIIIVDNSGQKITFKVTSVRIYKTKNFPIQEVFGKNGRKRLNLITCGGEWNYKDKDYSDRTVVYSEKVE